MALPKKGLRKIVVDDIKYVWNTTGNDNFISLSISTIDHPNRIITATFYYHSKVTNEYIMPNGVKAWSLKQQISITGYIVRQVIIYAIKSGWDPRGDVSLLKLGTMDDKVDLRIPPEF